MPLDFSQFGAKCASCNRVIQPTDWVRRARIHIYHLACFSCTQCKRQLSTGEEFALQEGRILCKQHFVELVEGENGVNQAKQKTKRVRTTFAEEQLQILQTYFSQDSNPDGADLERIANQTGLSQRVTQVWFQMSSETSEDPMSPGEKSETSSCEGMLFPTSVTTSAEEAICESTVALTSLQFE
ncbi:hypothetical protein WR25_05575 [Diploscapter pachys]|uniref:LIM/homeobox protein Awh n=1 Tax=Diploscapter pachys TaxID=2018661 RepID=A0A2A2LSX0_9BILA|nr:hypothetical protein WR25_05575 [Diploscapter pachys]